jgi:hypothetical protein
MIIAAFLYPAVGGRIGPTTLLTLAILVFSGLIWFYVARWYRMSKEGVDISWTFKSVPPV